MSQKRIEAETKSQIKVPKPGVQDDVIIIGPTRKSVVNARQRIEIIILAARNKQQFTHFLCIPFTSSEIKNSFECFKRNILMQRPICGLDESLFQNANKLHLTIGTLSLMDNNDRASAAQHLRDCHHQIINPFLEEFCGNIEMTLCGLKYMNDDPESTDILYGNVDCEPLQEIANRIVDFFAKKGFTTQKSENVKLHVTLINSLFRNEHFEDESHLNIKRTTFDAREILLNYKEFYFGKQVLKEIHLSQRYSTGSNGFYEATGILKI